MLLKCALSQQLFLSNWRLFLIRLNIIFVNIAHFVRTMVAIRECTCGWSMNRSNLSEKRFLMTYDPVFLKEGISIRFSEKKGRMKDVYFLTGIHMLV